MTKQTVVEWLFDSINTELIKWSQGEISAQAYKINVTRIKEQAKQMEKEKMENLIKWMYKVSEQEPMRLETDVDDIVQQYYNETYGK